MLCFISPSTVWWVFLHRFDDVFTCAFVYKTLWALSEPFLVPHLKLHQPLASVVVVFVDIVVISKFYQPFFPLLV